MSVKALVDTTAVSALIAIVVGVLPQVTIILTFLWAVLRIWESKTVQDFINRKKKFNRRIGDPK